MTRPLHLMVDIDEVAFPMMATVHERARAKGYHDGSAVMAWAGWMHYRLPNGEPLPEDLYWDLWSEFALEGGYVDTPPIEGAAEALRWLMWEGHQVHLVTARGFMANAEKIRAWTPEWIEQFAIPHASLTFAKDKVAAQETLGVKFDAAIDDSPKNHQALSQAGIMTWLQDHEHNQAYEPPGLRRVETLWEWAYQLERAFPQAVLA